MSHHAAYEDDDQTSPDDEKFDQELHCADPEEERSPRLSRPFPRTLQTVILSALIGIWAGGDDSGE